MAALFLGTAVNVVSSRLSGGSMKFSYAVLMSALAIFSVSSAVADSDHGGGGGGEKSQCIRAAVQKRNDAVRSALETFRADRLACKGQDLSCTQSCGSTFKSCRDAVEETLETCEAGCETTLASARSACVTSTGCGTDLRECFRNDAFRACIAPARLAAISCERACHDAYRADPTVETRLIACRTEFRTCLDGCAPASPSPSPTPTP